MVGQGPTPGYTFHYFYHSIDISDFLNEGRNIIAIHAYYQGMINRVWVSGDNRHGIICDIVDENDNILFCTDESTLCHRHTGYSDAGKCGYGTQFLEAYDAGATEVAATLRSPEKRRNSESDLRSGGTAAFRHTFRALTVMADGHVESFDKAFVSNVTGNTYTFAPDGRHFGFLSEDNLLYDPLHKQR